MNNITLFKNEKFGQIRTLLINNEPLFVGKDVAEALGYSNYRDALSKHVDKEDKDVAKCDTLGGSQQMTIINESGLYSLVMQSKLPTAKQFKRWVTSEVLPAIRKHGAYATPETIQSIISDPENMIKIFTALKEEQDKRKELEAEKENNKPKVTFAETVIASEDSLLVREVAKLAKQSGVSIGGNRLWEILRNKGYICKNSCEPTQKEMDMNLFEVVVRTVNSGNKTRETRTTKVTGKGQVYFINKLVNEWELA